MGGNRIKGSSIEGERRAWKQGVTEGSREERIPINKNGWWLGATLDGYLQKVEGVPHAAGESNSGKYYSLTVVKKGRKPPLGWGTKEGSVKKVRCLYMVRWF